MVYKQYNVSYSDKFQEIIIEERQNNCQNETMRIDDQNIKEMSIDYYIANLYHGGITEKGIHLFFLSDISVYLS